MTDYLTGVWAARTRLSGVEAITVNGLPAATAQARSSNGQADFRLLAIRYDSNTIYRFVFQSVRERTAALNVPFRETTYSFRKLTDSEAAALKPRRIRIHEVRSGETAGTLAARMPFGAENLRRFLVLNGLQENATLQAGRKVKIVTE